ncbi:MAG TPA: peptidoglycan DD-metalloendopeptidase family protein [Solirubrobacteraceae bacterium]|jgi:peptidoglycan hydrolase-like protein with peptidoglycan-binding domain|nr:peptidoglycan DD-metalloendopeptidase family protein [Solirubrobacteraceae bacterium]
MCTRASILAVLAGPLWALLPVATAPAAGRAEVAALQVALRSAGVYAGDVDGIPGPGTDGAVRKIQRRTGTGVDGIAGPRTRRAFGRLGRHVYGSRAIAAGNVGWDVAALQFKLAAHGFPSGPVDGALGPRSVGALRRFQAWAGLVADGVAGPATLRALRRAPARSPVRLLWPLRARLAGFFGPRGNGFHAGIDLPALEGTPVTTAGFGRVAMSGYDSGWGNVVVVEHRFGLRSLYAHLSSIHVSTGQTVSAGQRLGRVGSSGRAYGPHLHFELLLRGANIDPLSALG